VIELAHLYIYLNSITSLRDFTYLYLCLWATNLQRSVDCCYRGSISKDAFHINVIAIGCLLRILDHRQVLYTFFL